MTARYSIDHERETITFVTDPHTLTTQTEKISDLLETVMWVKSRERELRQIVFERFPVDLYQRMHKVGSFFIGVAVERAFSMGQGKDGLASASQRPCAVKVSEEDFNREMQRIEKSVRYHWANEINEKRTAGYVPIWSADGTVLNAERRELVSEEMAPDNLVYEAQAKVFLPEFWQYSEFNVDRDKPVRYP